MYQYTAQLIRVIDGDTLVVNVDLGFYLHQDMILRLRSINTPELKGKEHQQALEAKNFVEEQLKDKNLAIRTYKVEKWGRFLADVYYGPSDYTISELFEKGLNLNELLVEKGYAQIYKE
jgi:endonuclease YncB( thermonuclease family)